MIEGLKPYPRMKDSGVSWLGKVPEHWDLRNLRQLLTRVTERNRPDLPLLSVVREKGVILRDRDDLEENHNFIPDDLSNYKVVRRGQFAMNKMKAWQGSYGVSKYDGIVSPAYFVFDLSIADSWFFHTAIRSRAYVPAFTAASDGVRIGQWDLSDARMREIPFALPGHDEQRAIVKFVEHANRRIGLYIRAKHGLVRLLEEQKQAIIQRAVTRGLDPNIRIKPAAVEGLGHIPEHWDVVRNGQVFSQRNETGFADLPILEVSLRTGVRVRDMGGGRKQVMSDRAKYKRACSGDVAYNMMRMWQGAVGVAPVDGLVSPAYVVAIPHDDAHSRYFALLFRTPEYMAAVDRSSRGIVSDRNRLYWEDFKRMTSCRPPLHEQIAIAAYVDRETAGIDQAVKRILDETSLLREYRIRLIGDAITGKLDVREAALRLPDAEPPEGDAELDDNVEEEDADDRADIACEAVDA